MVLKLRAIDGAFGVALFCVVTERHPLALALDALQSVSLLAFGLALGVGIYCAFEELERRCERSA